MGKDNLFHKRKKKRIEEYKRREKGREQKDTFLIVCEGKKTEPLYFESFKVKTADIKVVGLGANTVSLVKDTILLKEEKHYDQVWCVFDRDSFKAGQFNSAIQLAEKNNINVAYSNEAFELWYVLHFNYLHSAVSRKQYISMLNKLFNRKYKKNDPNIYNELLNKQPTAIKNAERLLSCYDGKQNSEQRKPSTTVHLLVKQLNKFI